MKKFGKAVVKARVPILIIAILLLIPSVFGYFGTKVNYDILSYLPEDIDTMKGQDILLDEFGKGAFSMLIVENMDYKDAAGLKEKIEDVPGVANVIWYDSIADLSIPADILPDKVYDAFNSDTSTLMAIFFNGSTSSDDTMTAIADIRAIADKQCFLSGMSPIVVDTKSLTEQETPVYVLIAVLLCTIVMAFFLDSFLLPFIFLLSIGMAIIYNLGSNIFLGEISFITQALTAVLQLGVTMDYSIFLWHSYKHRKELGSSKLDAMAEAVGETFSSVVGSSITTIAGFVALCFMSFTLGLDLGIVMAKGVLIGVICCVTVLPSLILALDKAIEKTSHRPIMPEFKKLSKFISEKGWIFVICFLVILIPALYGYTHTDVYYNLDSSLPETLDSVIANSKLGEEYNMNTTHMILVNADMPAKDANAMLEEVKQVDGISLAAGLDSLIGPAIPREIIPDELTSKLKSENWQLMLATSEYKVASDEVNNQVELINNIVKKYDKNGLLIGEAPCTKDLIEITDTDFATVSIVSIAAVFIIILLVFRSVSLPIVLVAVIEFAIFINMGIPCYTGTVIPFIASIVIGTIQLGATVDYAILMTNKYKTERLSGLEKKTACANALRSSISSIVVSALGFFAATFGVGLYSNIDMISSLCTLMARGAIISMFVVIFILPSMLMLFDKVICYTTIGMKKAAVKSENAPTVQ